VHDQRIRLGASQPGFVQAEEAGVFIEAGELDLRWRSCWMRSRLMMSASRIASSTRGHPAAHLLEHARHQGGRAAKVTLAPSLVSARYPSAPRGCRECPEDGDVQASMRPFFSRMVNIVQQRLVGCSWAPSPALTTLAWRTGPGNGSAGGAVANDNDVNVQRFEVARGVFECLALLEGGGLGIEMMMSAESRCSKAQSSCACGGGLDKQVHDSLAAQADFLMARSPTALKARRCRARW